MFGIDPERRSARRLAAGLATIGLSSFASAQVPLPPGPWTTLEEQLVLTDHSGPDFWMGRHADLCGDTFAVSGGLSEAGSVYVFVRAGGLWQQQARIRPSEQPLSGACAIDGDTLALAAYRDDQWGNQSGSVYVYVRAAGVWSQEAQLHAPGAQADDRFGWELDLDGDTLVVGATCGLTDRPGFACVFVRSGTSWNFEARLENPTLPAVADEFGVDVAVLGERVLIGAVEHANDRGGGFLFRRVASSWILEAELLDPAGQHGQRLGQAVALAPNTAVLTSTHWNLGSGAAFVFDYDGAQWSLGSVLAPSDAAPGDGFGESVALDAQRLVGCSPWSDEGRSRSGSARVFERDAAGWRELARLARSTPESTVLFGDACALAGDTVLVTATYDSAAGIRSGAAYAYELFAGTAANYCDAQDDSSGVAARMALNGSAGLAALDLSLSAVGGPASSWGQFFHGYGSAALPFGDGVLCVDPFTPGLFRLRPVVQTQPCGTAWHQLSLAELPPDLLPGSTLYFQYWFRDPAAGGTGFNLSDGLAVTFTD